jgi:AraC-like DNA-binding protein
MDFQTLEISFHPEGADHNVGRITHFAQFVENKSVYAFPSDEDFLGIFINLGDHQRYMSGDVSQVFLSHHYSFMYLTRHAYNFTLERGFHSWLCLHYSYDDLVNLSKDVPLLQEFLQHLHNGDACVTMTPQPIPAPYGMLDVIRDMMHNRFTGASREYYLYMKSVAVLAASLMHSLELTKIHLSTKDVRALETIRDYLADNIKFNHTAAELADKAGMSEYHLKQRFLTMFGKSVPTYLLELRMNKAKQLLKETGLSIKDIALMVGYNSASTFVHAFHREMDISPGGYRAQAPGAQP